MKIKNLSPLFSTFLPVILFLFAGCSPSVPKSPQWKPLDVSNLNKPLTLEECLILAGNNDIQLVQWKARLDAAHAELIGAKTIPNPAFAPSWDDIGLKDEEGKSISNVIYGFSWPILFWLPQGKEIKAAKAHNQAETEAILAEKRQLSVEIASAYFGLVIDQRKVKISENLLQIANESMRLVSKQKELQIASDYDLDRVHAEQLKAESDLLDAKSNLSYDQLSFAFALGADKPFYPYVVDCNDDFISDSLLVTRDSNDQPQAMSNEEVPQSIIETALQASPDWRQKKADVNAAEYQLQAEYRKAIPLAETSASYGPKDAPEGWGSAFSLEFPIPLFDRNQAGISRAKAELTAAQAEEEKTRRDTIAAVSQAWERYHSLSIKWNKYTKPIAEMAEKNEKSASRLFEEGQINYEEFLIAQRDNKQAQVESLDVWINTSLASWMLSSELGLHDQ